MKPSIVLGVFLAAIATAAFSGYRYGVMKIENRENDAVNAYRDKEAKLLQELENERKKRKVVVRERIRTVREVVDVGGCADQRVPDNILQQIPAYGETKPSVDG